MPTKITRAEKRAKKVQVRNARRVAASRRRAYRLVARYERKIEAKNTAIAEAIKRQKVLIAEWRDTHRNALAEIQEEVTDGGVDEGDGRERPDDAVAAVVGSDQAGSGEGRVLSDPVGAGGSGGSGAPEPDSYAPAGISSVVGY